MPVAFVIQVRARLRVIYLEPDLSGTALAARLSFYSREDCSNQAENGAVA